MKKIQLLTTISIVSLLITNCGTPNKTFVKVENKVSYKKDIAPIMTESCTPCHMPPQGRKEPLDNYIHVKENITEILALVQLPTNNRKFMPPANKKPALTTAQIELLKQWQKENMPE